MAHLARFHQASWLLWIVSMLLLYTPGETAWSDGHEGVDRPGFDIETLTLPPNSTSSDCFQKCMDSARCEAWVFRTSACPSTLEHVETRDHFTIRYVNSGNYKNMAVAASPRRLLRSETPQTRQRSSTSGEPQCSLKGAAGPQKLVDTKSAGDECFVTSGVKRAAAQDGFLPLKYRSLPLGTIAPTGWLEQQLRLQANSLSGHLDLFWDDVMDSAWIGGKHDNSGAGHERGPYWLNGVVPLAALLNATGQPRKDVSVDLANQTWTWVRYVLEHQAANGWLGPDDGSGGPGNIYWQGWNMAAALLQYGDAVGGELFAQCNAAVLAYITEAYKRMVVTPMASWSQNRAQDWIYIVQWMFDQNPQGQEQLLWDAAELAAEQRFDWDGYYERSGAQGPGGSGQKFPKTAAGGWTMWDHGVNNAMATKGGAVLYRQTGNASDAAQSYTRLHMQDKYHGQPHGMFAADECFGGRRLNRGIELCAVVEQMYSLEAMFRIQGDPAFMDRAERIAFNALPATISPDMWQHQYLQLANEITAQRTDPHSWITDGPDSTFFGVEPNFGCCTVNFNQGWPKLAAAALLEHPQDGGVALAVLAPLQASLPQHIAGGSHVTVTTNYPFEDEVNVQVAVPSSADPVPFYIRVPAWATSATVTVGSGGAVPAPNGTMFKVLCPAGTTTDFALALNPQIIVETTWGDIAVHRENMDEGGYSQATGAMTAGNDFHMGNFTLAGAEQFCNSSAVCVGFTFFNDNKTDPSVVRRTYFKTRSNANTDHNWLTFFKAWNQFPTNAVAVTRGTLVYALHLSEEDSVIKTWKPFNNTDINITTPDAWNFGLVVDPANPATSLTFYQNAPRPSSAIPFDIKDYPSYITAKAFPVTNWVDQPGLDQQTAEPPVSPVTCDSSHGLTKDAGDAPVDKVPCGGSTDVMLVPYGATDLRITAMPWAQPSKNRAWTY